MASRQPDRYGPRQHQQYERYDPQPRPHAQAVRKASLATAEAFRYILMRIAFGATVAAGGPFGVRAAANADASRAARRPAMASTTPGADPARYREKPGEMPGMRGGDC
jgi:hypothetical protein